MAECRRMYSKRGRWRKTIIARLASVLMIKSVNSIDSSGVAFAAIQGLNEKLTDEVKALRTQLSASENEAAKLKARLAKRSARDDARLATIERKLGL